MAYVVAVKPDRYEVRESRATSEGPRSRTLVSFREFTDAVVEKAQARAEKPPTAADLRRAALRAGAPIRGRPADDAARTLLRLLAKDRGLDPMLRRLLLDALEDRGRGHPDGSHKAPVSDAARAAAEWAGVTAEQRGEALRDLLELADALPMPPRSDQIGYPRLQS